MFGFSKGEKAQRQRQQRQQEQEQQLQLQRQLKLQQRQQQQRKQPPQPLQEPEIAEVSKAMEVLPSISFEATPEGMAIMLESIANGYSVAETVSFVGTYSIAKMMEDPSDEAAIGGAMIHAVVVMEFILNSVEAGEIRKEVGQNDSQALWALANPVSENFTKENRDNTVKSILTANPICRGMTLAKSTFKHSMGAAA